MPTRYMYNIPVYKVDGNEYVNNCKYKANGTWVNSSANWNENIDPNDSSNRAAITLEINKPPVFILNPKSLDFDLGTALLINGNPSDGLDNLYDAWGMAFNNTELRFIYNTGVHQKEIRYKAIIGVNTSTDKQVGLQWNLYSDGNLVPNSFGSIGLFAKLSSSSGATSQHIYTDFVSPLFVHMETGKTMYYIHGRIGGAYRMVGGVEKFVDSGYYKFEEAVDKIPFDLWIDGYTPEEYDSNNPYIDGGTSGIGGGEGNFSENSDSPETDSMPVIGAVGTGFATIFKPSISQLRDLSALFWNSNVFTFLQNLVENITNMFTSLAMVPFEVDAGSTVSVTWLGIDTAISLTLAAKQYYEFDMGSINMDDDSRIFTSGSVLDYSPFSKLGIYLPFIGYQDLDIDECRGAVINLRYRIDILSGACVAILKVGGRDLYQFTGNCLTQIPITNESMQSLVSDAVNVGIAAAGVGAAGASAGAGLAEAAGTKEGIQYADVAHAHATVNKAESGLASASANAVIGSKPTFNKSGAISSSASMMALKQPFLFLSTPRQSIPSHYQRYRGFPSNITSKLGDLSGFTVVEDIRLNGLVATSPEVAEIYDLLKKGVII